MANVAICPACEAPKAKTQYLCRPCWFTLSPAARTALKRTDMLAFRRLSGLLEQIRKGVPLSEIEVAP